MSSGRTVSPEAEEAEEEEEQDQPMTEWRPGVRPTATQRAAHEATHVPYAWWCGTCVEGQGRGDAHRKVRGDGGPPFIELDYSFMRTSEPEDTMATVLLGYTKRSSYGFAMKVDKKGPTDRYAVTNFFKWLS